ncbi:hypothetical protein ACKFRT_04230 [Corynebacterium sp. YSMAA1_1_F7]|uniref:hypothetical protein n=1 Tax=Corynebacterium sp. YSMAA1_1_F7 TaxID=3383590 RepID=UPI0038D006BA
MPTSNELRETAFKANGDVIRHINALLPDHTPHVLATSDTNDLNTYRTTSEWLYTNDDVAARQNYRVEVHSFTRQGTTAPQFHTVQVSPLNLREYAASATIPTTAQAGVTRDLLAGLFDLVTTAASAFPTDNDQ